ncbi:MAG: Ig-like domain-containing protein, partial [Duncaniella sp.]|nr:Ig-like domain-containing protein [Duncaniella sp.]
VLPEDVTDKKVAWTSSEQTIVKVDEDGNVTAIAEGEAVITASCGTVSANCLVKVEGILSGIGYVENDDINISVNGSEMTIETTRNNAKVTIVRPDGAVIYSGDNRGLYYLAHGIYIVVVNNTTRKILIN